jgi:ribosomal protein L11 methyltransferase
MTEPVWYLVIVEATPDDVDALVGTLTLHGADAIEERDDTTLARGGALGATVIASFTDVSAADEAYASLRARYDTRRDTLRGDAWRDAWKDHWRPTRITPRVVVVPSWLSYTAEPGDLVLTLDPGRAFGTGQHASTALAARAIERLLAVSTHTLMLDLGCGSGILAFVAAMQGVAHIVACDVDADSVASTRENARALGLSDAVTVRHGGVDVVTETASLVVANIEAPVLIPLAREIAARVAPGGCLVLSGVLVEQRDDVARAYEAQGLALTRADVEGQWIAPEFWRT